MIARDTLLSLAAAASLSALCTAAVLTAGVASGAADRQPLQQYNLQLVVALCVAVELAVFAIYRRLSPGWPSRVVIVATLIGAVLVIAVLVLDLFLGELGGAGRGGLLWPVIAGAVGIEIVLFRQILCFLERRSFGSTRLGAVLLTAIAAAPLLVFALLPFGKFGGEL